MFIDMDDKLLNDEVLSGDPVMINLLANLTKIVENKCRLEEKLKEAFQKEINEMDAGPAFKK